MIFELAQDFQNAVAAMPAEQPKHCMLSLFKEAIRRDIHFIARHPTTLFQCMWNACAWNSVGRDRLFYLTEQQVRNRWRTMFSGTTIWDDEQLTSYHDNTAGNVLVAAFDDHATADVHGILTAWRSSREQAGTSTPWLRSLRPPRIPVAAAITPIFCDPQWAIDQIELIPDGYLVIRVCCCIHILHYETRRVMAVLDSAEGKGFIIAPDGSRIAWWRRNGSLAIAGLPSGEDLTPAVLTNLSQLPWQSDRRPFVTDTPSCGDAILAANGHRGATLSESRKSIKIWNLPEQECLGSFDLECEVSLLGMSHDGERIVVSDLERPFTVRILDVSGILPTRYVVADDRINCACFVDEYTLVVGSNDRWCYAVDIHKTDACEMLWHSRSFSALMMLSPCERFLVGGSGWDETFVYDTETGLPLSARICHETRYCPQQHDRLFEVSDRENVQGIEVLMNGIVVGWLPHRFQFHTSGMSLPIIAGYETHIGAAVYIYHLQAGHCQRIEGPDAALPAISELWHDWGRHHIPEFTNWLKALVESFQLSHMETYAALMEQEASVWASLGKSEAARQLQRVATCSRALYTRNEESGESDKTRSTSA